MALAATVPTNANVFSTTAADFYDTGSWSGSGGSNLYVACFMVGITLRTMTVTGNGLTWTNNVRVVDWDSVASPVRRMGFATAVGTPTTGATRVDGGAGTDFTGGLMIVVEITGADTATANGIVQHNGNLADTGTAQSVSLSAFGSATNGTLGFFCIDTNSVPTAGTGSTPTNGSGTFTAPASGGMVEFLASEDTSVTATGGSSVAWAGIAMEIKELVSAVTMPPGKYVGNTNFANIRAYNF